MRLFMLEINRILVSLVNVSPEYIINLVNTYAYSYVFLMLPHRPKMAFGQRHVLKTFTTYVKGILAVGEASKNKLNDTSFIFPMTNVTILGVFGTHAQKEYGKVWEMQSTHILNILALLLFFKTSNAFAQSPLSQAESTLARSNLSPFARCTLGLNCILY